MHPATPPRGTRFRLAARTEAAIVACLGLGLTLLAAVLAVAPPSLIRYLDHRVYDSLLNNTETTAPSDIPVLIGIDDQSLRHYGQWPWPRYRLALLIDRLNQAGAQAIALDLLMPEADRTSPEIVAQERRRDLGNTPPAAALVATGPGNDQVLAATLASAPVVLSYKFEFSPPGGSLTERALAPLQNVVVHRSGSAVDHWPRPAGALTCLPLLARAAPAAGFVNSVTDEDGILRRIPLLIQHADGIFPNLAFATLLQATKQERIGLTIKHGEATVDWNGRQIPLDRQGNLLLAFRGPRKSYRYISAAEVLTGAAAAGSLRGRVAIVGAWASGLGDRHVTPADKAFPGMEIHAVAIDNLLAGRFLQEPPWARGAQLAGVLLMGLLATFLLTRFGFVADLLLIAAGTVLTAGGAWALFVTQGIYLSPAIPLLLLFAICGLLSLVKYGLEVRKVFVRTCELAIAQDATILGMTLLAASRDKETGAHILRTQRYVEALARELRHFDKYRSDLTEEKIELLFKSAPLHDIGKVGIPDAILRKPGNLSEEEYRLMKNHTLIGSAALDQTMQSLQHSGALDYLDFARQVTISHHEKWDGSGYPGGLKGEEIPLAGRLMALADVYDALISERVYKSVMPHEQAKEMILAKSGTHFDPDVVTAFLRCEQEFLRISREYSAREAPSSTVDAVSS